jgi:hypothetical protein
MASREGRFTVGSEDSSDLRSHCARHASWPRSRPHDAVLALLDWLPEDVEADAEVVGDLLGIPEAEAARLLDELEAAGDIASATGSLL